MRWLNVLIVFVLFILQTSFGTANVVAPSLTSTNTLTPITNTPMPTKTTLPSQTPSPAPVINGIWSDEPPMLIPRSAHAAACADSAIYALAGTDDHGKPILEVEVFDGKQLY
jgi:hypothetical protein